MEDISKVSTSEETRYQLAIVIYASDLLIMGRWSYWNILNLFFLMESFRQVSGLKVNLSKSSLIGINIPAADVQNMANFFQCKHQDLPIQYLGLPLGGLSSRTTFWNEAINRLKNKLP
uniref:Reverse transcriptase domain-containing protein n=1 Tax=Utricularia reniformis TaxID=192314 RepID=A0A1Y0B4E0_9LAMI|nr:hypothetical protein AEK19_MT2093 [Utricularia reniformis]ART32247.1 hypothetical protein AEK19_MT2093 [Utricularia reniformis]